MGLTSEEPRSIINCTKCGKKGHFEYNCWGNCPVCGEKGHRPGSCEQSPEKLKIIAKKRRRRKRFEENKRLKSKLLKTKTQIDLPHSESSSQYWVDSLSDADTVVYPVLTAGFRMR